MTQAQIEQSRGYTKPLISLQLRFSDKVLNRLYDDFDAFFLTKNADGSLCVTIAAVEDEWLYGYIMSFGKHVTVLAPEHVKNIIIRRTKEVLENYSQI
jgi:predicted DNA-binding transcriptional regulator YafY